jgi:hypothetical protein
MDSITKLCVMYAPSFVIVIVIALLMCNDILMYSTWLLSLSWQLSITITQIFISEVCNT